MKNKITIIPCLHRAINIKIAICIPIWIVIQKMYLLHVTFIVQYNKAHLIVLHCSVIVTSQSTYYLD